MTTLGRFRGSPLFEQTTHGVSPTASAVAESLGEAARHLAATVTSQRGSISSEFKRLVDEWKRDTEDESSPVRMAMHPAYQRIIGMGPAVLPWILGELEMSYDQWFWALKSITGVDPVPEEDRGYLDRMARSWARWGRQNGITPRY